jgi:diguanylate cyclase (GGDEF)-like protein
MRGLDTSRACAAQVRIASTLDVIASIYSVMEEHTQALAYHAEALTVIRETGDQNECSAILNNSAMTLMAAGFLPEALEKGQEALELARAQEMAPFINNNIDTIAQILFKMGELERAEELLREAIEHTSAERPDYFFAQLNKSLGQVCLATGKYDQAIVLFNQAITDLEQLGARGEQAGCYRLLSQVHERQGNFALALEQYKTYEMHREATSGKEAARRITALIASYDIQLAQRDAEIERLRNVDLQNEIEERKRIQAVLEKIATIDALTNLYNRGHFFTLAEREVERALRYKHPLTALMIDIDNFKAINDRHGHIAGDQILVVLAGIIRQNLRDVDLAGRYGGEEFTILLPETSAANALLVAERIRAAIVHQGILTDAGRVPVTVSVGAARMVPTNQTAPRELIVLLDRADRGLYQAKHAGRNCSRLVDG